MSVHIEVLGPGCARCQTLYENAKAAVDELGIEARVDKIDDVAVMVMRGIMQSPALTVNGTLVLAGRLATPHRLGEIISAAI
ncbi:MAG TPA: thioredoxin family protein [Actinomycetota bacterium]|nr:thioredoxin family protein [Actinomycetota bacterium]